MIYFEVLDYLYPMKNLDSTLGLPKEYFESEEKKNEFEQVIQKLPSSYRCILVWYLGEELTIAQIASKLNCSKTTIYNKLYRAIFILKNQFNPILFQKSYRILYPERGRPASIDVSIFSECDQVNSQNSF